MEEKYDHRRGEEDPQRREKQLREEDRKRKIRVFRRTLALMLVFGIVLFVPLIYQLYDLQILQHDTLQEKAAAQQTRDMTVSADRGTIYDAEGNILAISATVQNLILSPKDIAANDLDKSLIASGLAELTGVDAGTILEKMEKTNSQYEIVKRKMEEEDAEAVRAFIKENKLSSGVYLEPDSKRYYPYSSLASNVLGFVGTENSGLYGLEMSREDALSGKSGRVITAKNGAGTQMLSSYENYVDGENGLDHHLTINATIQGYAEKALREGIEKYDVQKGGFCIVMNPKTGGILAMASDLGYDLNDPSAIADEETAAQLQAMKDDPNVSNDDYLKALGQAQLEQWNNRCVSFTYEPGSTFKAVVLAAALEEGVVNLNSQFYCSGSAKVAGYTIHCSRHSGHGAQDLTLAVKNSCNPAFMEIGQKLGAEKFYDYLEDFGLLQGTGIDLGGEQNSIIWNRKYFTSEEGLASLAVASFGQTLKVTPIQLITAACATVNGGYLVTPHVVDYTTDADGNVVERVETNVVRQVISEETSEQVRNILEQVVATGTGKNTYQAGYRIGGKTGTSEKRDESSGDLIVSFLGIAPANDPEIVVLLAYDSPKASVQGGSWSANGIYISGGNMAAPMAGPLIRDILDYMGVEKQYSASELSGADTTVPKVTGYSAEQAEKLLQNRGFTARIVGDGETVTGQIPASGAVIPGGSQVVLYMGEETPEDSVTMPDLTGLTPEGAKQALAAVNLYMRGTGSARYFTSATLAANQSIAPGTEVARGSVVEVTFVENVNDFADDNSNIG